MKLNALQFSLTEMCQAVRLLAFKLTKSEEAPSSYGGVSLTPGNVDDRKPVPDMTTDIFGKLFGDRGYISQALFEQRSSSAQGPEAPGETPGDSPSRMHSGDLEQLYQQGLQLIT